MIARGCSDCARRRYSAGGVRGVRLGSRAAWRRRCGILVGLLTIVERRRWLLAEGGEEGRQEKGTLGRHGGWHSNLEPERRWHDSRVLCLNGGYEGLEVRDMLCVPRILRFVVTRVGREMFVGSEAAAIGNDCWTGEPEARDAAGCVGLPENGDELSTRCRTSCTLQALSMSLLLTCPFSSRVIPDVGPGVRALGLGAPGCAVRWAGLGLDGTIPAEFPF